MRFGPHRVSPRPFSDSVRGWSANRLAVTLVFFGYFRDAGVVLHRLRTSHVQAIAVASAVIAIGVLHYVTPFAYQHWHEILQHLYFFPVVYAGLTFGWRGGAGAALLATLAQVPHIIAAWVPSHNYAVGQILELPLLCAAGALTGVLVERERQQRQQLARTTERLSVVYAQLQENFDQMKRAERLYAVGQLAAGLAHEIRNPLASIAGASGILQRNATLEDTHLKVLHVIDKECQRLTRLLGNFLDFARPRPPKHQQVDVGVIAEAVMELARHAASGTSIILRKEIAASLPKLTCDPEMLSQLLLNLVINAIQATGNSGVVAIRAAVSGGKIRLSVADEGCGVPAENRDKIFDPFFTTKEGGTGLGLSVAHQIVDQHGGVLTAEANPDKGMTFIAAFPLNPGTHV